MRSEATFVCKPGWKRINTGIPEDRVQLSTRFLDRCARCKKFDLDINDESLYCDNKELHIISMTCRHIDICENVLGMVE